MRVFVSADIEGITGVCHWDECDRSAPDWALYRDQMQDEVNAACEGALAAGATRIRVRDAHASARNLRGDQLPGGVELVREWSGHPHMMIEGIDDGFDALVLIGYHSEAGSSANPLAHTMTGRYAEVRVNGARVAELHLHAWMAAELGIPLAFASGDEALCAHAEALGARAVASGRGQGRATIARHPADVVEAIRTGVTAALADLPAPRRPAGPFALEVDYKDPRQAWEKQWYPGARLATERTVRFETDAWFEVLRALRFL
ncbi:MAG: M55 family metallopeptidase [Alphaproteobacteria bacterium]|nr:M55 family metallopeptidase [Alphaproteobacteria bacterium]